MIVLSTTLSTTFSTPYYSSKRSGGYGYKCVESISKYLICRTATNATNQRNYTCDIMWQSMTRRDLFDVQNESLKQYILDAKGHEASRWHAVGPFHSTRSSLRLTWTKGWKPQKHRVTTCHNPRHSSCSMSLFETTTYIKHHAIVCIHCWNRPWDVGQCAKTAGGNIFHQTSVCRYPGVFIRDGGCVLSLASRQFCVFLGHICSVKFGF